MRLFTWLCGRSHADSVKLDRAVTLLHHIDRRMEIIMASQAEVAAELRRLKDQNEKARAENVKLLGELREAIANGGQSTPEVDAALAALAASIQAEDDENPDAPTP